VDPVAQAKAIVAELKKYDGLTTSRAGWCSTSWTWCPRERAARVKDFVKRFKWKGPVFEISALTREGCEPLIKAIYEHVQPSRRPAGAGRGRSPSRRLRSALWLWRRAAAAQ
jgi:GTP-binding protein